MRRLVVPESVSRQGRRRPRTAAPPVDACRDRPFVFSGVEKCRELVYNHKTGTLQKDQGVPLKPAAERPVFFPGKRRGRCPPSENPRPAGFRTPQPCGFWEGYHLRRKKIEFAALAGPRRDTAAAVLFSIALWLTMHVWSEHNTSSTMTTFLPVKS